MNQYLLIMAGGSGSRLWPISTSHNPKQYLKLYSDEIMINETIRRVEKLFDLNHVFIIINESQKELAYRYIDSKIPRENIITEPIAKNTSMCIFYATIKIKQMMGEGVMAVLSADHYIKNEEALQENIKSALSIAQSSKALVTIGIVPTYPATCYGYLKYQKDKLQDGYLVEEFKEKPPYETAVEYFNSGNYLWNSGMFFWRIDSILENFQKNLPNISKFQMDLVNAINTINEKQIVSQIYQVAENISIDKGIMEKSNDIKMVKSDFEWSDIGSIKSYFEIIPMDEQHNRKKGKMVNKDTKECNIYNQGNQLLITVDVENITILNCNNVIVVCRNDQIETLKQMMEYLKKNDEYYEYL